MLHGSWRAWFISCWCKLCLQEMKRQLSSDDARCWYRTRLCFLCSPYQRRIHSRLCDLFLYTPSALRVLSAFCCVLCYCQQHSQDFLPAVFIGRPVKIVPEMTYNVLSGTLSLYTTTSQVDLKIVIGTRHDTQNCPYIPLCYVYVCIQNFSPLVRGVVGGTISPLFSHNIPM